METIIEIYSWKCTNNNGNHSNHGNLLTTMANKPWDQQCSTIIETWKCTNNNENAFVVLLCHVDEDDYNNTHRFKNHHNFHHNKTKKPCSSYCFVDRFLASYGKRYSCVCTSAQHWPAATQSRENLVLYVVYMSLLCPKIHTSPFCTQCSTIFNHTQQR